MKNALTVETPSDREIRTTRIFNAPRDLVFDAHTKPELVQRWLLGPPRWSMPTCEIDLRIGGRYRYVWRHDESGREFGMGGVFKEIAAPQHIVHTERYEDSEALITLVLVEKGDKTELILTMLLSSKEARDGALKTGMTDGMEQSYVRLDELLASNARGA